MTKEEIKAMIKDCVYLEDGITYMSDKQYNNYIDIVEQLQKENQKYKEAFDKAIKFIDSYMYENYCYAGSEDKLKEILEEVNR